MKEIESEFCYPVFNGVDELLDYLVENSNSPYMVDAEFQGDMIGIFPCPVRADLGSILIVSPKYREVAWLITNSHIGDRFRLSLIKGSAQLDELLTVELPNYVRNELIATLKGEW